MSKKETVIFKREEISTIIDSWPGDMPQFGFVKIKEEISCCDCEDGGGDYRLIIKRLSDNKYFSISYQGWDRENDFEDFEDEVELDEVIPTEEVVIVYK